MKSVATKMNFTKRLKKHLGDRFHRDHLTHCRRSLQGLLVFSLLFVGAQHLLSLPKQQLMSLSLASVRDPAMMRMTPVVHRTSKTSPLESIALRDELKRLDSAPERISFGVVARRDFSKGADLRHVDRVHEIGIDYSVVIPGNLSPVRDAGGVSSQIIDHTLTSFFKQGPIKNTFVGRAAETVEKKMKAEVDIGGSEPDSIQHNIKFQVKASETKASMEYRGITNAALSYVIASRKTNLEISESLGGGRSNIVYTHSDEPNDRRDVLSLRLHW